MHQLGRDERGFAMMTTVVMMVACAALALAAYAMASGDQPVSRQDAGRKQALQAAQAGVAWYAAKLDQDPDYWLKCSTASVTSGVNPISSTVRRAGQTTPATYRPVAPGSSLAFTIELLPVSGAACSTSDPSGSMLGSGNQMRIRVTGRASGITTQRRSLVATFRRPSLLDYVYFTVYEVTDPDADANDATTPANCGLFHRDGRAGSCSEIQWGSDDRVSGPLHTNDQLFLCGNSVFGRKDRGDLIEVTDPTPTRDCGSSSPTWNGTLVKAKQLDPPPTDASLATVPGAVKYSGTTQIHLAPGGYYVRSASTNLQWTSLIAYPASKLLWVGNASGTCAPTTIYSKYNLADEASCGNVYVSGTYGSDLTIGAANDVIVAGDLTPSDRSKLLGLIGENYVRVFHPVTFKSGASTCDENDADASDTPPIPGAAGLSLKDLPAGQGKLRVPFTNPKINAGMLAVKHSFIVDNYKCGDPLGDLGVTGAIAQRYRGPVASVRNGQNLTGYDKNYQYEDQLAYREPPNFLDPVKAAWIFARQVEQVPAS